MEIKRVVRFQNVDVEKIEIQQNFETVTEDVNLNSDIITKEDLKEKVGSLEEKSLPSSKLSRCVRKVVSKNASTNLIGVFGINSDVAVGQLQKELAETDRDLQWLGTVVAPMQPARGDIYNVIVSELYHFLNRNTSETWTPREKNEVLSLFRNVWVSEERFFTDNTRRNTALLEAINKIRQKSYSLTTRSRCRGYLIAIEMERMNYRTLSKLANLRSPNLVIIVYSLLDYDSAARSFEDIENSPNNIMNKFFSITNWVDASE